MASWSTDQSYSKDRTLEEILSANDVLQSCYREQELVKFLQSKERMKQMILYAISVPPDVDAFKYSFVSCAILSSGVDEILTTLACDVELMDSLFAFLGPEYDHDGVQAGYFSKIVTGLLSKNTEQLMHYMQNHGEVLVQVVDLVRSTSIMEILMLLVGADKIVYTFHSDSIQWLAETELLDLLMQKLGFDEKAQVHANVANVLCTVMTLPHSPLALKLCTPRSVKKLFSMALGNFSSKSSFVHTLSVCISLLEPEGVTDQLNVGPEMVNEMLEYLGDMLQFLHVSEDEDSLPTTYGVLRPPFGSRRLKIVEFLAVLLRTDPERVGQEFVQQKTLQLLLDSFFDYPFNNLLHRHVETILLTCVKSSNATLIENLFQDCDFIGRLLSLDKDPFVSNTQHNHHNARSTGKKAPRVGNIGHLTRIANNLVQVESNLVQRHLERNPSWNEWKSSVLQERNAMENVYQWECGRPMAAQNRPVDSNEDDFCDRDYGISALAGNLTSKVFRYNIFDNDDAEEDAFFEDDSAEVVIKSVRLCDEEESARLFGWYPFHDDLHTNPDVDEEAQNMDFSLASNGSSSSSCSDEEGVANDDELADTATSLNEFSHLECGKDEQAVGGDVVGVTSDLEAVELVECSGHEISDSRPQEQVLFEIGFDPGKDHTEKQGEGLPESGNDPSVSNCL